MHGVCRPDVFEGGLGYSLSTQLNSGLHLPLGAGAGSVLSPPLHGIASQLPLDKLWL